MFENQREHQLIAYEALQEIDRIFKKHNIRYYLLAGTTLGAIRHKGFIPWDDDIDIGIFSKDKEQVSRIIEEELSGKFQWLDMRIKDNFPRFYGKVLYESKGCVDIFLLVKTSNVAWKRELHWFWRKSITKVYQAKIGYIDGNIPDSTKKRVIDRCSRVIARFLPLSNILRFAALNESRYNQLTDNVYYINMYSRYVLKKEMIQSEWLQEPQYVLFETDMFPTVSNPDAYLTHLYGDYMTPPPESERKAIHEEWFDFK